MPKLTVVTTLFNVAPYLEQAIRGCINQTFKDFQWIIINDGSTDNTGDVLESMFDKIEDINILHIDDGKNKGLPARLNQAIERVDTEFFCLLDGDDISYPSRFITQLKTLEANPNVWACGSLPVIINDNGIIDGTKTDWYHNHLQRTSLGIRNVLNSGNNPMMHPSMMFRTQDHPGYDPKESRCPDLDLWYRTIDKDLLNVGHQLIQYRIHPNNLSGKFGNLMEEDRLRIFNQYSKDRANVNSTKQS